MILRVGLTGGIASGKSTVSLTLAGLGCVTIDADSIVARLYRPGEPGYEALVHAYGPEILRKDGEIDRAKLASIAFADDASAKKLNSLIHPLVIAQEESVISAESRRFPDRDRIVVVEATLLLESGGKKRYDRIVVVDSEPELQIERAVARGMDREDARRRMARQMPREERRRLADYVIENNSDIGALEAESIRVYDKLRRDGEDKKKSAAGNPTAPQTKKRES
ncbi:MAG TPA: dephospho-CoA kinase [Thermoanaerobaculia bacterium]|nr:dephospho-CoA kinase [Thermoanaerobaculia bacterium]